MLLRPLRLRHIHKHVYPSLQIHSGHCRTFFPQFPFPIENQTQKLRASRHLPYPISSLYPLVVDIAAYPSYLPFCTGAKVLTYSSPDSATGARHPATASLSIGWKGIQEEFVSRVYCLPDRGIVEAVSGCEARSNFSSEELRKWGYKSKEGQGSERVEGDVGNDIFWSLRTEWALQKLDKHRTEVNLAIEIEWKTMLYATMSRATLDKVGEVMVAAFVKRAEEALGELYRDKNDISE